MNINLLTVNCFVAISHSAADTALATFTYMEWSVKLKMVCMYVLCVCLSMYLLLCEIIHYLQCG